MFLLFGSPPHICPYLVNHSFNIALLCLPLLPAWQSPHMALKRLWTDLKGGILRRPSFNVLGTGALWKHPLRNYFCASGHFLPLNAMLMNTAWWIAPPESIYYLKTRLQIITSYPTQPPPTFGGELCTTRSTSGISKPRAATLVATRTLNVPFRKPLSVISLCFWGMSPCNDWQSCRTVLLWDCTKTQHSAPFYGQLWIQYPRVW